MGRKVAITQSNYIPWKGYFDNINSVDEFILFDDMQYTKRDWRNRNKIKTREGVQWLTIPVEVKGKYFQKIRETKISETKWGHQHWKCLVHNYHKAKYFDEYKHYFEPLYLNNEKVYLSEVNFDFIKMICEILHIKTKISWSSDFELIEGKTERLIDLCKKVGATEYYTGPSAKEYIDEDQFEKESIKVIYFDYNGYLPYTQLNGEFTHEVSVVDLIFNEGKNAPSFMKSFKNATVNEY